MLEWLHATPLARLLRWLRRARAELLITYARLIDATTLIYSSALRRMPETSRRLFLFSASITGPHSRH